MRLSAVTLLYTSTLLLLLSGCKYLVDEDLSDCGGYNEVDCELRLQTNMQAELSTVLDLEGDIYVSQALESWLGGIFSAYARDIDLSFYEPEAPFQRLEHLQEKMNGKEAVYSFYLPAKAYLHHAVANIRDNDQVFLESAETVGSAILQQKAVNDTVHSFNTGIFTGRKEIRMEDYVDNRIDVHLYFTNAASALVLDEAKGRSAGSVKVYATGFADGFQIADSCFLFRQKTIVCTEDLPVSGGSETCYAAIHFPSRDSAEGDIWGWHVYVSLPDGTVTCSVLGVKEPLQAGCLKIIKAKIFENGVVSVNDPTISVSVKLDWHEGEKYDLEL